MPMVQQGSLTVPRPRRPPVLPSSCREQVDHRQAGPKVFCPSLTPFVWGLEALMVNQGS